LSEYATSLNDIDAIKAACEELGLQIREGGVVRYYYQNNNVKADYVISWAGSSYDVGLKKDIKTGNFHLVYDTYNGQVEAKLGKGCCKLIQSATFHKIAVKAKLKGWFVTKRNAENGALQVVLAKG